MQTKAAVGSALAWVGAVALAAPAQAQTPAAGERAVAESADSAGRLSELSLEQLSQVQVTSVSRSAQPVGEAPASIYVITADDLDRAGVRSIPGALRLAPNLQVARIDSATYGVTARGFNHSSGTANKLQVLMDGRIVYTPLFSGVFWDEQNTVIEDIDRIEVISGPGGALWGSNAVNGVINIVSRDAHETTGALVSGGVSNRSEALALRYGARFGDLGAARVYALGLRRNAEEPNEWRTAQAGFRADWGGAQDTLTLQGDVYSGGSDRQPLDVADASISGANLLGRWTRRLDDGRGVQVQAYVDRATRRLTSGIDTEVDAAALDAQYNFALTPAHEIVLGGGVRATRDSFAPGPGTSFLDPERRTLRYYNLYLQDTFAAAPSLDLIFGVKLEHNPYTGSEYKPSARLAWRPSPGAFIWAAVSRAVRTPSRVDRELINPQIIDAGADFVSETLVAYELGYRGQPSERFWYSLSGFYNVYDDLRTLEATGPAVFPLEIRNGMSGETYGLESWGSYAVTNWWRVNGGLTLLRKDLQIDPGSADVFGVDFAGNDPEVQATLRSLMDLSARVQFDVAARYVGELPEPRVPSYVAVDAKLSYRLSDRLELSLSGYNLLGGDHVEFVNPALPARENEQTVFVTARWRS